MIDAKMLIIERQQVGRLLSTKMFVFEQKLSGFGTERAMSNDQRAESREQRAESREQSWIHFSYR